MRRRLGVRLRGRLAFAVVLACGALPSCKPRASERDVPTATASALAPVPAPTELAAELVVPNPERTLTALRESLGDDAVLLPRTVGGLAVSLFGLPLRAAQEFDERLPAYAALGGSNETHAAIALHVHDGSAFVVVLASGADATFDVERTDGVARLTPKASARQGLVQGTALGVVGNYLVIGTEPAAVTELGPYLVRTMATRPEALASKGPRADVSLHAEGRRLGGVLSRLTDGALTALGPTLRSSLGPLFDSKEAGKLLGDAFGTALSTDATLVLGSGGVRFDATLTLPSPHAWTSRRAVSPALLGALRRETVAALLATDTNDERKASAGVKRAVLVAAFAAKAGGAAFDGAKLDDALTRLAEGRGDTTTLGASCTGAGVTGFAFGDVSDRQKLVEGAKRLVALRDEPAVKRALDDSGLDTSVESGRLENVSDDVTLVRVAPKKKDPAAHAVDLRFTIGEARYAIAAGAETVDALQALYRPDLSHPLREVASLTASLDALGPNAYAALYLDPSALAVCRLGGPAATEPSPILAALTPSDAGLHVVVTASRGAVGLLGGLLR